MFRKLLAFMGILGIAEAGEILETFVWQSQIIRFGMPYGKLFF